MNRMLNKQSSLYLMYDMILGHVQTHMCTCLCSYTQPWSNNAIVNRRIPAVHSPAYPGRNARCTIIHTRRASPHGTLLHTGAQRPQHEPAHSGAAPCPVNSFVYRRTLLSENEVN